MYMPIQYHLVFILIQFILMVLIAFMFFVKPTVEKTAGGFFFIGINFIFSIVAGQGFGSIDAHGFDSSGTLVHNLIVDMDFLAYIYLLFGFINVMLVVYGAYLFMKKPWDEKYGQKNYSIYENRF